MGGLRDLAQEEGRKYLGGEKHLVVPQLLDISSSVTLKCTDMAVLIFMGYSFCYSSPIPRRSVQINAGIC